jgi:hypothetical protein
MEFPPFSILSFPSQSTTHFTTEIKALRSLVPGRTRGKGSPRTRTGRRCRWRMQGIRGGMRAGRRIGRWGRSAAGSWAATRPARPQPPPPTPFQAGQRRYDNGGRRGLRIRGSGIIVAPGHKSHSRTFMCAITDALLGTQNMNTA